MIEVKNEDCMNKINKLRILHSAALLNPPSGIINQMKWENNAAKEMGIPWKTRMYCPKSSVVEDETICYDQSVDAAKITNPLFKVIAWFSLRINYYQWLKNQTHNYDIFVLRYYVHDPFQWWFVKNAPIPVYFVHHTLEVPEMALSNGLAGLVRSSLESVIGKYALRAVTGSIGVTEEILSYENKRIGLKNKKGFIYPNGIIYDNFEVSDTRKNEVPELLFVANFAPWHGLDLLLNEMENNVENFILHLVGNIMPKDVHNAKKDSRVIVHGKLTHKQIVAISNRCWIGLSAFGLSRKKMLQACTLKTREYLMTGLPVYSDHFDVFPIDFPYYQQGKVNMSEILEFARKMRNVRKEYVSSLSEPYINKKKLLMNLYSTLCNQ
jgi:glycosyltransferase involved in cell wall biosynthesis